MTMGVDAIIAILGLLAPPVIDFVRKKFLRRDQDSPEATMSTLATTKPDVLPSYVTAMTGWLEAQVKYFNRDVSGTPSPWVCNLRASIRPIGTILSVLFLATLATMSMTGVKVDPSVEKTLDGVRYTCEAIATSWFGDRITITK